MTHAVGHPLLLSLKKEGYHVHGEFLGDVAFTTRFFKASESIVFAGRPPTHCFVLLEGFAATFKIGDQGKRQICALHVPGDIPDLQCLHLDRTDATIAAVRSATVAFVKYSDIRALCRQSPELNDAFWRASLVAAARTMEWLFNVGQRQAPVRIAHLFCEIYVRMMDAGLATEGKCTFPIPQIDIADATGVSPVHVNRSIQDMRRADLIRLSSQTLHIPDLVALTNYAGFDPSYLHLRSDLTRGMTRAALGR